MFGDVYAVSRYLSLLVRKEFSFGALPTFHDFGGGRRPTRASLPCRCQCAATPMLAAATRWCAALNATGATPSTDEADAPCLSLPTASL